MAGFLRSHGVFAGLAFALVMAPLAPGTDGAEPCHHVVGGRRGWDVASNISEWSLGKEFRVGDSIWFKYSAADDESVVELGSREAFESCDLSNPIRMYTEGVNKVSLDGEGHRYFASGRQESCRAGLKLHVAVLLQPQTAEKTASVVVLCRHHAAAPADGSSASGSASLAVSFLMCVRMAMLDLFVA